MIDAKSLFIVISALSQNQGLTLVAFRDHAGAFRDHASAFTSLWKVTHSIYCVQYFH